MHQMGRRISRVSSRGHNLFHRQDCNVGVSMMPRNRSAEFKDKQSEGGRHWEGFISA